MVRRTSAFLAVLFVGLGTNGTFFGAGFGELEPDPPTGLSVTVDGEGIHLEWTASPRAVLGYNIYRSQVSTNADPVARLNAEPITGTGFTDSDVTPGVFFCYTVRGVAEGGYESLDSNEVCDSYFANAFGVFKRGDVDGNGKLDITDPIFTLGHLFLGTFTPECLDAADFNDSGLVQLDDAIGSLNYQFLGGPPPPAPGAYACGLDPTPDGAHELGCSFHICEDEGT